MHHPPRPGNLWLRNHYDALLGAQARIAKTAAHTEALIAAATAAIDRTRSTLTIYPVDDTTTVGDAVTRGAAEPHSLAVRDAP